MNRKYVDTKSIVQVIGCVYNNPSLLNYGDKYILIEEDFPDQFHKIIFGAIYNLFTLGVTDINIATIKDFLAARPKSESIFNVQNGEEWLIKASKVAIATSFDYYYQRLKKMTLLRAYDSIGVSVTDIYDPFNLLDVKQRQRQEEYLDNTSLEDLATQIDNKISVIRAKYVDNYHGDSIQIGTGLRELINKLKETPDVGIPMYSSLINTITRGARLRKFYLRSAPTGTGKALVDDSFIPTPSGLKQVKDIKVGDYLFDDQGNPTRVLKIFPQPAPKEVWRVRFMDGRYIDCCEDHLWKINKRGSWKILSTKEIYESAQKGKYGFKHGPNREFLFNVPLAKPAKYFTKDLSVDPYLLGAFLTKGITDKYNHLMLSTTSEKIAKAIAEMLGKHIKAKRFTASTWGFFSDDFQRGLLISDVFYLYPYICHVDQPQKIPREYLEGSIEQRYSLLQGICDFGANVTSENGKIRLDSISSDLLPDVQELMYSLGFRGNKAINSCIIDKINLVRKYDRRQRLIEHSYMVIPYDRQFLGISNIEKLNYTANMTCFTVDNPNHLFLANNYVVTHNTRTMIADACYFACDELYDINKKTWSKIGTKEPTLYITTEQDIGEVQTMMLAFLSGVEEEHLLTSEINDEDEGQRIDKAISILENSPLYLEELPDFSLQDIEDAIVKGIRDKEVKYVVLDYIHTSMKILEEITRRSGGVKLREDNILFMISIRLKDICNKYGIFILSATQLNGQYVDSETPDQNLLRGRLISCALIYLILLISRGL